MKKIKTKHDLKIPGWGLIPAGTPFKVIRYNKLYVYVQCGGCELKLARKSDCEVVY